MTQCEPTVLPSPISTPALMTVNGPTVTPTPSRADGLTTADGWTTHAETVPTPCLPVLSGGGNLVDWSVKRPEVPVRGDLRGEGHEVVDQEGGLATGSEAVLHAPTLDVVETLAPPEADARLRPGATGGNRGHDLTPELPGIDD